MRDALAGRHLARVVLVVDDVEAVRLVSRRILEGVGYQVLLAANGIQALVLVKQAVIDAVVTDIRMPELDGWQLAAHLKVVAPHLPILFISGFDAHISSATLPGPILAKPFTPAELIASVGRLMLNSPRRSVAP